MLNPTSLLSSMWHLQLSWAMSQWVPGLCCQPGPRRTQGMRDLAMAGGRGFLGVLFLVEPGWPGVWCWSCCVPALRLLLLWPRWQGGMKGRGKPVCFLSAQQSVPLAPSLDSPGPWNGLVFQVAPSMTRQVCSCQGSAGRGKNP